MNSSKIKDRIVSARIESGLSHEELATQSGVSKDSIVQFEDGIAEPRYVEIKQMAVGLGVSPAWLAFGGKKS
jgi:ribosome-binding protein aMBF1 (putative translation factor)